MARFHATSEGNVPFTEEEELQLDAELAEHAKEQPKILIKAEIAALETTITPRRTREAILGTDNGWLAGIELQIGQLRQQLGDL